jgi:hypothetical protein
MATVAFSGGPASASRFPISNSRISFLGFGWHLPGGAGELAASAPGIIPLDFSSNDLFLPAHTAASMGA